MWLNFVLGFLGGVLVTLTIGNSYVRFHIEKFIRNIIKRPSIFASLRTVQISCENGMLFLHCIELKNRMWFTPIIPNAFCNTPTTLNWYDPLEYFFDPTFKLYKKGKINEVFKGLVDCATTYTSNSLKRSLNIYRHTPRKVIVIAEPLNLEKEITGPDFVPLNHIKKVGDLHLGTRNFLPVLSPGHEVKMSICSEQFGFIDQIGLKIPANLKDQEPLGDSKVLRKKERPPVLADVGVLNLTWPLRLEITTTHKNSFTNALLNNLK